MNAEKRNIKKVRPLRLITGLALLLLLFLSITPKQTFANAASDKKIDDYLTKEPTPTDYTEAIHLYAYLDCLRSGPKRGPLTEADVQGLTIVDNTSAKPVGYIMDPPYVHQGDGKLTCTEIQTNAFTRSSIISMGVNFEEFIDYFYDKDANGSYILTIDGEQKIESALSRNFLSSKAELTQAQLLTGFSQCYDENTNGSLEKAGKKYGFLNGKDRNSKIPVGWWMTDDGYYECETISDKLSDGTLTDMYARGISTGSLRNNSKAYIVALAAGEKTEDATQTAINKIILILAANPQRMLECAAVALPAGALSSDVASAADASATVLVNPEGYTLSYDTTEDQKQAYRACLVSDDSPYKDAISAVMDELDAALANVESWRSGLTELGSAPPDSEGGDTPQSDDCLSSDDFLGWFVCPVLNLVDSVLETLEDVIQGMLRFSLEDTTVKVNGKEIEVYGQNQDDELHTSWNIFRSIATILLTIGFLIALLTKAIKG